MENELKLVSIVEDDGFYEIHFNQHPTEDEAAAYIAAVYKVAAHDDSVFSSKNEIYDGTPRLHLFEVQLKGSTQSHLLNIIDATQHECDVLIKALKGEIKHAK